MEIMILRYLSKREVLLIALCVVITATGVMFELEIPEYMQEITMMIEQGSEVNELYPIAGAMVGYTFASVGLAVVSTVIGAYVATSFCKRLRELQYRKVQTFSKQEIDKLTIPSMITRSTNDITQIQVTLSMGIVLIPRAPIMAILALNKISHTNIEWTLATIITLASICTVVLTIMFIVIPRFKKIQRLTDNLNKTARENITGIRVVKAYNAKTFHESRFQETNVELTANNMVTSKAMSTMFPIITMFMNGLNISIYWIGAILLSGIDDGLAKIELFSNMVIFTNYSMQVVMSILILILIFTTLPRALVSTKRVEEVIKMDVSIKDGGIEKGDGSGTIRFENVSFRYPNTKEDVISDIDFDVSPGEVVAIIGTTGSGKSTLVNLIPRLYDVTSGSIKVDGVDVREYNLSDLRAMIGYVPQEAVLFSGTMESNINFGITSPYRTEEDIREAARIAQADGFIDAMVQGYDSQISQHGTNLSGGQKQRVSIARAICKKPKFYIFDDTFSALDYKTDSTLRRELKRTTEDAATLIVAQRVSTIMNANTIIVIKDGRIIGKGVHSALMKDCPHYKEIVLSQMSEKEAESC